jgi:hypothetical protein
MSLWTQSPYPTGNMPASSVSNPLEMFTSCTISDISVQDATIHTLYRPPQKANDIILVLIHGYPQTHIMWRSVKAVSCVG